MFNFSNLLLVLDRFNVIVIYHSTRKLLSFTSTQPRITCAELEREEKEEEGEKVKKKKIGKLKRDIISGSLLALYSC